MKKFLIAIFSFYFLAGSSFVTAATKHALVVGVSEYPNLKPRLSLIGPKNDAKLINEFLLSQNFEPDNITLLADGVEKAELPTRENIISALDTLAQKSSKGDFVYMHFAGHGSQQPVKPGKNKNANVLDETDGLDEIFLPRDVEEWNDTIGEVKNAIVDDTIGQAIDNIRKKGAFVWVVFDSCHSGTMTRSVNVEDERERKASPSDLGIPVAALINAEKNAVRSRGTGNDSESLIDSIDKNNDKIGGYVAFYAAQTTETTPEMNLPKGNPERKPHGLFTYSIINAMSSRPGITYRQAAQKILQQYTILKRHRPTPLFEGQLDYIAMSNSDEPVNTIRQWKASPTITGDIKLKAGTLNQLSKGSILGIYEDPTDEDSNVLGYIEVTHAKLTESTAKAIRYNDKPMIKKLPAVAYARLHSSNISYRLVVALPDNSQKKLANIVTSLTKAIQKEKPELSLELVPSDQQADIRLYIDSASDKLWFLPPTGQNPEENPHIQNFVKISSGKIDKVEMTSALSRIAKLSNLLKLGDTLGDQVTPDLKSQLFIEKEGKWIEIQAHEAPKFKHQQPIKMVLTNESSKPVDVTLLFIDSRYGITPVFPNAAQTLNRIEPSKSVPIIGSIDASTSTGVEGFMVIAAQAEPQSQVADFSFLAQKGFTRTRALSRGKESDFAMLLSQAGFGKNRTRGFGLAPATPSSKSKMQLFRWTTTK